MLLLQARDLLRVGTADWTEYMTPEARAEIAERWAKVTPGPWVSDGKMDVLGDSYQLVATEEIETKGMAAFVALVGPTQTQKKNAEAIAHAPEDIAALLAEVEALNI